MSLDLEPLGHELTPHYELGPQLGLGAYGSVHRARERATGREVALKLLNVGNDPLAVERFLREAAVTANLDHPGIVRVHAVGAFSRRPAIVYELVEGEPLSRAMRTRAPRARAALVRDAAAAVGHAHARGVVHRDLKPDNILVDAEGRVRVADFGLALVEGADRLTRTGALVGTPSHMAPERFLLERAAPAPTVDVWSLGVVLYEALTGRLPFDGESMVDLAAKIEAGQLTPPRAIDRGLDPALEAVCLRALARDPARRQPDGAALAQELDEALAGRGRAGRRSRAWLVGLGVLLTVGALGALLATSETPDVVPDVAPASDAPAVLATPTPAAVAPTPGASDAPATAARLLCEGPGAHWALWVGATRVVSGGAGLGVRLWDTTTGEVLRAWSVDAAEAARVADGTVLVSAQGDTVLHLDPAKDEVLVCFAGLGQVGGLTCAASAPRAAFFVGADRRRALVIDTTSGRVVAEVPAAAQAWRAAALSSDGELLALSDELPPGPETEKITSVRVFDVSGAALRARRSVTGLCRGLGFDDRGRRLFVGSSARLLLVLDLHGDEEPWPLTSATAGPGLFALGPPAHAGSLVDLAATADGRRLVSVAHCPGDVTEVKVWNLAARVELADQTFTARGTPVTLDLAPDGRAVAVGVRDSGVHLRPVR